MASRLLPSAGGIEVNPKADTTKFSIFAFCDPLTHGTPEHEVSAVALSMLLILLYRNPRFITFQRFSV